MRIRATYIVFAMLAASFSILQAYDSLEVRLTADDSVSRTTPNNGTSIASGGRRVYVTWSDNRSGVYQVYFKMSTDAGSTWTSDTALTSGPGDKIRPSFQHQFLNEVDQCLLLVWEDHSSDNPQLHLLRSPNRGQSWYDEQQVTYEPVGATQPSISLGRHGCSLVWIAEREGAREVYYRRSRDSGATWSDEVQLSYAPNNCSSPNISDDPMIVLWVDSRDSTSQIYSRHSENGVDWSQEIRLSQEPADQPVQDAWATSSGNGWNWAVWRSIPSSLCLASYDLHSHIWGAPTTIVSSDDTLDSPCLYTDDLPFQYLLWVERSGGESRLRRMFTAVEGWSPDSTMTRPEAIASLPSIHYPYVVWTDQRDGNPEIYFKTDNVPMPQAVNEPALPEVRLRSGLQIAPNPFRTRASVVGREKERFKIVRPDGRIVAHVTGAGFGAEFASGVYFLIATDRALAPTRLVKLD